MPSDSSRLGQLSSPGSGVHRYGLLDDETVGHELSDGLPRIGIADFGDLVRIKPDPPFAATDHRGRETLLRTQVDPALAVQRSA